LKAEGKCHMKISKPAQAVLVPVGQGPANIASQPYRPP
jgi:hypothetical protein